MQHKIVQEVTPETMYIASYEHFRAYELYLGKGSSGELYDTPELAWAISGVHSSYMNSVVRTELAPNADVDKCIEAVLERAKRRSVPMGWFLLPGTTPADMESRLLAHGLTFDDEIPGMSVDLHTLPDKTSAPDNLRIVEVLDLPMLEQWTTTWRESYNSTEARSQSRYNLRASQGLDSNSPYRSFLAYLGAQPVATSELFIGAGVAAVVWVGTIPSARRLGIGAAITLAPLLEARRLGYRIGALTSSSMGYRVYQQLGFQEMCRFPGYYWSPGEE